MKKTVFLISLLLAGKFSFGQSAMENYPLKNVGFISIPANMEVQSNVKTGAASFAKETVKNAGFDASDNRIVFKEKGINDIGKTEYSTYARVILKTTIGNEGDFEKLSTNLTASPSELSKLDNQLKSEVEQSFAGTGVKLINWNGVKIVTVNGRTALNISYSRQLNNEPFVAVSIYQFNNNDRIHKLTLSYVEKDAAKWEPLYAKILTSFTISNVR